MRLCGAMALGIIVWLSAACGDERGSMSDEAYMRWFEASWSDGRSAYFAWLALRMEAWRDTTLVESGVWHARIRDVQDELNVAVLEARLVVVPDRFAEGHMALISALECMNAAGASLSEIADRPSVFITALQSLEDTQTAQLGACSADSEHAAELVFAEHRYGGGKTGDAFMQAREELVQASATDWNAFMAIVHGPLPSDDPLDAYEWGNDIWETVKGNQTRVTNYAALGQPDGFGALAAAELLLLRCRAEVAGDVLRVLGTVDFIPWWEQRKQGFQDACAAEERAAATELAAVR